MLMAEATNRRFFGDSKTPHTPPKEPPTTVQLFEICVDAFDQAA